MTYPLAVRCRVFGLLGVGVPLVQAAARVGVSAQVVRDWRREAGGVIGVEGCDGGRYLRREERYEVARLAEQGLGVRAIAARLGRSPSTVSRELRRNHPLQDPRPGPRGSQYQPERAQQMMLARRARPRPSKLAGHPALRAYVQTRLDEHDSPEQIAGRLRYEFGDDESMQISHETIYQAIYVHPRGELKRQLRAHLRTGRDRRRPHHTRQSRTGQPRTGSIPDLVSIHDRPAEIEERLIPGHCEGDLIVGPVGTSAAIGTLVERCTSYVTLFHLPDNRGAEATVEALTASVQRPEWSMRSLTWDRGGEMARHRQFTLATGIAVYFADPHAPWQRGSNENTNGLLREFFPKGTDLAHYSTEQIQSVEDNLNNRPRKRLGYRTPKEAMAEMLNQNQPGVATTP